MKSHCPECETIKENISALLDGELKKGEAEVLVKRIRKCAKKGCSECLSLYEDLLKIECAVVKCRKTPCKPPARLFSGLKQRLRKVLKYDHHKS